VARLARAAGTGLVVVLDRRRRRGLVLVLVPAALLAATTLTAKTTAARLDVVAVVLAVMLRGLGWRGRLGRDAVSFRRWRRRCRCSQCSARGRDRENYRRGGDETAENHLANVH
jgi:hypothetical protein